MGTGNFTTRSNGQTITAAWFNEIQAALQIDHLPRNASGVPTDEAGSLGNADYQWLNGRFKSLYLDGSLVSTAGLTGLPHRIISGKEVADDGYPAFLTAVGAGNGLTANLLGADTSLVAIINDTATTLASDTTFTSLTAAPGSNNTCLANTSATYAATHGELNRQPIVIDTIGSEISSLDGEIAAFITGTEVFLAEIDTSNNKLWPIYRGWAGTDRGTVANNATITLLKLNVLLLKNDGSTKVASIYYPATVSEAPAAATAGKVYIERSTNYIGYDTGVAIDYDYMVMGYAVCDDTDCLYVEPWDFDKSWKPDVSADYEIDSTTQVLIKRDSTLNVAGDTVDFYDDVAITSAADMLGSETISASKLHYLYVATTGDVFISAIAPRPLDRLKMGYYHPSRYYRCIGALWTNSSNEFVFKRQESINAERVADMLAPVGSVVAWIGGSFGDGSNGTFTSRMANTVAGANTILPHNWRVCNGAALADVESPIFDGASRYLPNLTDDRFIMGDTTAGAIGGANNPSLEHNHNIAHAHQWGYQYNASGIITLKTHTSLDDSTTSIDSGDNTWMTKFNQGVASGGTNVGSAGPLTTISTYTTGVLSPPAGAAGATAASGAMSAAASHENRPVWLSALYIMRVK